MANQIKIAIDQDVLLKIASFISAAVEQINTLTAELSKMDSVKQASVKDTASYKKAVEKVAELIRSSDLEYMIEDYNHNTFVKEASASTDYFVATMNSLFNVVDPIGLGKTASVKSVSSQNLHDPVYQRAFGTRAGTMDLMFD